MKLRQILVFALVYMGILWLVYPRFTDDVQEESERSCHW